MSPGFFRMAGRQLVVVVRWRQSNCVLRPVHCFEAVSVVIWARPTSEFFALVTIPTKEYWDCVERLKRIWTSPPTLPTSQANALLWGHVFHPLGPKSMPFRVFAYGLDCWPLWPNRNWLKVCLHLVFCLFEFVCFPVQCSGYHNESDITKLILVFTIQRQLWNANVVCTCISFECETTVIKLLCD